MSAYFIIRIDAKNPALLKDYQSAVPPIVEMYRGKFIVRGGATITLEGPEETRRIVVIEFPEVSDVTAFYNSPEYTEARKLREGVAVMEAITVEGIE